MSCSLAGRAGTRSVWTRTLVLVVDCDDGCKGGGDTHTLWRCPGAVVEKREIQVVVYSAIRG